MDNYICMIPVKVREKRQNVEVSPVLSSEVTHLFSLFNLCCHDSHIFHSPSPSVCLLLTCCVTDATLQGEKQVEGRRGARITLSPSARQMLWRCHQTVYGTAAPFHWRQRDRWVGCCCSHCCWMTHADPDSNSVTHQSHHSDFAQIRGRWPCCTGVAPAAVSPLPHQGGAADHTRINLQQTATSPASLLTFKFEGNTLCIVFIWNTRPAFIWCTTKILYNWSPTLKLQYCNIRCTIFDLGLKLSVVVTGWDAGLNCQSLELEQLEIISFFFISYTFNVYTYLSLVFTSSHEN